MSLNRVAEEDIREAEQRAAFDANIAVATWEKLNLLKVNWAYGQPDLPEESVSLCEYSNPS